METIRAEWGWEALKGYKLGKSENNSSVASVIFTARLSILTGVVIVSQGYCSTHTQAAQSSGEEGEAEEGRGGR